MARESDLVPRVSEIAQLPADIDALHVLVAAARAERDAAIVERDHALSQIDRLRHLLRQLRRAQFGRRSEKLDPEQLLLALEDIEQAIAGNEAADDKKDPVAARARSEKRRANRGALPIHLPHVDVTIEPEDTNCPCCRAPLAASCNATDMPPTRALPTQHAARRSRSLSAGPICDAGSSAKDGSAPIASEALTRI